MGREGTVTERIAEKDALVQMPLGHCGLRGGYGTSVFFGMQNIVESCFFNIILIFNQEISVFKLDHLDHAYEM